MRRAAAGRVVGQAMLADQWIGGQKSGLQERTPRKKGRRRKWEDFFERELGFREWGEESIRVFLVFGWRYLKRRRTRGEKESSRSSIRRKEVLIWASSRKGHKNRGLKSGELPSVRKLFRYGPCSLPSLFCFWISIRFYFGVWMRASEILLCSYGIWVRLPPCCAWFLTWLSTCLHRLF